MPETGNIQVIRRGNPALHPAGSYDIMGKFRENYVMATHLEYPEKTMANLVADVAERYPNSVAYEFYNCKTTYSQFVRRIDRAARAFLAIGVRADDRVTICLPNTPQALDCFYAVNRIGAVSNMVHPQSAQSEISFYLNVSHSKVIVTVDMFYEKVLASLADVDHEVKILVIRIQDELPIYLRPAYAARAGRPFLKFPNRPGDMLWSAFVKRGDVRIDLPDYPYTPGKTAVILYSGGTSGVPKGICLSDMNFNALSWQTVEASGAVVDDTVSMLSCMPVFHGFGLGINIHTMLTNGCRCVLMPNFNLKQYTKLLKKKRPNFIAGVPTIFEALLHITELDGFSLDFLLGVFSGGDSLSVELKKKVDSFLREHDAKVQIREGYGLTECVTASCLTPRDTSREGSIGIPYPDTFYRIVQPGTFDELPYGEEGEIILSGPSVMIGYLDNPEETAETLRTDDNGRVWLFSGDLGRMDSDGYVYFSQRMKRMIITNGYNVYPGQIENVIDGCEEVAYSCVIGVPDERRMQKVKAFIVLRDGVAPDEETKGKIKDALNKHVARYAIPREIEFRPELPKTLVGKVAFRVLEEEEAAKIAAAKEEARIAAEKNEEAKLA